MGNKFLHKILVVALVLMSASLSVQAEELCMEGTLLFREDFGGNDPSDPGVSTTPVQGMSSAYSQVTNLAPKGNSNDMGSGHYLVAKQGYRNSTLTDYSIWHIMDDHTYPGDKTRGYLLEVDGKGGTDAFFQTTMSGLCAGSKLTFSAYIANLETAGQYAKWKREGRNSANPKLSFVITNLTNGAELARYNSDTISHDWSNYPKNWRESADWQLVGMTFIVPEGVETVKLSIHNNVSASNGNDFALDDIEVRLCAPPVSIEGEAEVCTNSSAFLTTNFTNDGTFAEPLEYKWWFSADSVTWADLSTTTHMLSKLAVQKSDSGWYKVAVAGAGNIASVNCRAVSEPFKLKVEPCAPELCMDGTLLFREDFGGNEPNDPRVGTTPVNGMTYTQLLTDAWRSMGSGKYLLTKSGYCNGDTSMTNLPQNRGSQWHLQDDHTYPNDKTRGYLLEIDGKGGNSAFYSTTIEGLCEGSRLTFSAYVANVLTWGLYVGRPGVYAYPRLKFVLTDPSNNAELATYDTGDIPFDSAFINDYKCWQQSAEWRLVGMNFTVPPGQNRIKLTIYNNTTGTTGNDFAIDDIEVRLCAPPVTIEGEAEVCTNEAATLSAQFTNDGTFAEPVEYKWFFSADSVSWGTLNETSKVLNLSNVHKADSGWYQVAVAGADNIESLNCRAVSEPFRLRVNECVEPLCIDGTLLFREDFGGNDPNDPAVSSLSVPGMSSQYHNSGNSLGSGNYTVRKQGWHNGIQWHLQDDHTYPGDYTRGYLLEVDGRGGAEPFYSKTIDGLCAGSKLTFSAYVVNVHYAGQLDYFGSSYVFPRMKFVLKNPTTGAVLAEKSTGDIQPDWRYGTPETWKYARDNQLSAEWQLIGMNFVVPDGIESIQMYIYNDVAHNGSGNDFALDDIEIHLCAPPVTIAGESEVCTNTSTTITANFSNDGTFAEPLEYKWWHSTDSITWTERPDFIGKNPSIDAIQKADSGWYKAAVSGDGNIESVNCRAVSEPFRLRVNECEPPVPPCPELQTLTADTTVCDTLMPYRWRDTLFTEPATYEILYKDQRGCDSLLRVLTLNTQICCPKMVTITVDTVVCDTLMPYRWRDTLFTEPATYEILYKNERGCDSLIRVLTLGTQVCCPNVVTIIADTTVCDTLMPFTWTIGGQTFVFEQAETQEREMLHPKWTECTGTNYVLRLDTFHCEKLWQIIVNKYNWQLLLDNVSLSRFFPQNAARTYQWYKNEVPIPGANGDDYSEQNELCGRFQLRVEMDNGQTIWSNILEIGKSQVEEPIRVRIYDSHGVPVQENQVAHGVYLYRYEQGDRKWTEKRLIP